jgi:hypothetical protein
LPVTVCNHRERRCQDSGSATLTVWSSGRKVQDSQPDQEAVQQPGIGFARLEIENIQEAGGTLHNTVGQFAEEGAHSRLLSAACASAIKILVLSCRTMTFASAPATLSGDDPSSTASAAAKRSARVG